MKQEFKNICDRCGSGDAQPQDNNGDCLCWDCLDADSIESQCDDDNYFEE